MDTEIKNRLLSYLSQIESGIAKTTDFANEQIPLYVQELLSWMMYDAAMSLMLYVFLAIASFFCLVFLSLKHETIAKAFEEDNVPVVIGAIIVGVASFFIFFVTIVDSVGYAKKVVKISVAPRVVLVEELKKVINEKN